jgi:UDPglucose 6-dehydrogenase
MVPAQAQRGVRVVKSFQWGKMSVKITMLGTGYVGLVTGACLAELGHNVICVDKDAQKIANLLHGKMPIYEPGLDELVTRQTSQKRLSFSTDVAASVKGRDAVFIAVGTPSNEQTGRADLKYVEAAAREVGAAIDRFTVVVTKSTVPVGTNRLVAEILRQNVRAPGDCAVASNPEFLREGAAITDFMEPDRVVVGCENAAALEIMRRIYAPLSAQNTPFVETDIETAEMIKYAANAFLAVKVSFINEISDLCEAVGAEVSDVARGIGLDNRIGSAFLRVGPGWGGSCFPKDTRALEMVAQDAGMPLKIVGAAMQANDDRKRAMAARIVKLCGGNVRGKKLAVLGLTFKGQTDDMRESPSLDILPLLIEAGAEVRAFDPSDPHSVDELLPDINIFETPEAAATGADALIVLTDWMVFKSYDLAELSAVMSEPLMIDLRNLFGRQKALDAGFKSYFGLGSRESFALNLDYDRRRSART